MILNYRLLKGGLSMPKKRTHKLWTRQEEKAAEALYQECTAKEVAKILGRTASSVKSRMFELPGGKTEKYAHWTPEAEAILLQHSNKAASELLGFSYDACRTRRYRLGKALREAQAL